MRPQNERRVRDSIIATILAASFAAAALMMLSGCSDQSQVPIEAQIGPDPALPEPVKALLPTIKVAEIRGWSGSETPKAGPGLRVATFAADLDHPRWLYVLPNGDVLVAEAKAPPRPDDGKGIKGFVTGLFMKKAGAAGPSANRITLLRDSDGDGTPETRSVFLEGLNSPHGMALVGNEFTRMRWSAILMKMDR
jgi:glucose/arabinose dehydrogenase